MKVALLLSGKFRNSFKEYKSIKKNIIEIYNPDVFISYDEADKYIYDDLVEMYNPIAAELCVYPTTLTNEIESVKYAKKAIETNIESVYKMWYSIYNANLLKSNYELNNKFKYDIVIRCRFDIKFEHPLNLKKVKNSIFIPIGSDHRGGYNDLFAYGTSEEMNYYCSTYTNITKYVKDGCLIHPERILKYHLDNYKLNLYRTNIPLWLREVKVTEVDYIINEI